MPGEVHRAILVHLPAPILKRGYLSSQAWLKHLELWIPDEVIVGDQPDVVVRELLTDEEGFVDRLRLIRRGNRHHLLDRRLDLRAGLSGSLGTGRTRQAQ